MTRESLGVRISIAHPQINRLPVICGNPTAMFRFQLVIEPSFGQTRRVIDWVCGVIEQGHSAEAKLALVKSTALLLLCLLWLAD